MSIPKKDEEVESLKIICLGDSAVGKSKLVERFLVNDYYALTLFNYETKINGKKISVEFWDTAGQERFSTMHASYYHEALACILVFDATRKITYKNLPNWYEELRKFRPNIPCLLVANKIDADLGITQKSFGFGKKNGLPQYFVSAADGTNVVKLFRDAIKAAYTYKQNPTDYIDQVLAELENIENGDLEKEDETIFNSITKSET